MQDYVAGAALLWRLMSRKHVFGDISVNLHKASTLRGQFLTFACNDGARKRPLEPHKEAIEMSKNWLCVCSTLAVATT
jgi:hypothetical protein